MAKKRIILEYKSTIEIEYETNSGFVKRKYATSHLNKTIIDTYKSFFQKRLLWSLNVIMNGNSTECLVSKFKRVISARNRTDKRLRGKPPIITAFKYNPFICNIKYKSGEITQPLAVLRGEHNYRSLIRYGSSKLTTSITKKELSASEN